jgi:hypothetical protein
MTKIRTGDQNKRSSIFQTSINCIFGPSSVLPGTGHLRLFSFCYIGHVWTLYIHPHLPPRLRTNGVLLLISVRAWTACTVHFNPLIVLVYSLYIYQIDLHSTSRSIILIVTSFGLQFRPLLVHLRFIIHCLFHPLHNVLIVLSVSVWREWDPFPFCIKIIVYFLFTSKWRMVWWWPEKMAETAKHCKLLTVLLYEGILNKYIDWVEQRGCVI